MRKIFAAHAGKIILTFAISVFALTYYLDELEPGAMACKAHGGKKLYGECWVPLRNAAR